ncbi:nucleotidyltransferase domain-containing protein [Flavobacterium sp.]|uniref:nucleotidyltransferase domain-containing protein n=1 Tax=Flavobacterium sp. TaxID=239 RepID=UPI003D0D0837
MNIADLKAQNLILFEVIAGSKAFGLDTPSSDTDIKGVFYLPKDKFFGLEYIPQISNETNDIVYYELGRFVELLLKNNPNILEMLATPEDCILYKHPIMEYLRLEDFLSKLCKDTFAGYAMTQIKKARGLKKKIVNPMDKERKSLIDFCFILQGHSTIDLKQWLMSENYSQAHCGLINIPHSRGMYAVFYDAKQSLGYKGIVKKELSNEVALSSIPKDEKAIGYLYCNQDGYSQYCKEYKEYWDWIAKRNEERYNVNVSHGKNYDSKNMMHTVRLLQSALQIAQSGTINIRVSNREELLNIKAGNMEYEALMQKAEQLIAAVEMTYPLAQLPEAPNKIRGESVLVHMRKELYDL